MIDRDYFEIFLEGVRLEKTLLLLVALIEQNTIVNPSWEKMQHL